MYLVKNGTQAIASYETHEAAFDYFLTVGGFASPQLHIENEKYNCFYCEIEYGLVTVGA
jgi:hypothetical protein